MGFFFNKGVKDQQQGKGPSASNSHKSDTDRKQEAAGRAAEQKRQQEQQKKK